MKRWLFFSMIVMVLLFSSTLLTQEDPFVFGDPLPDAPELSPRGDYNVGVQTLDLVNPDQVDIVNANEENPSPLYDRPITIELWYPSTAADDEQMTTYDSFFGRSDSDERVLTPFSFPGRATRDAEADVSDAPYPLVILSHGFPGHRLMMTYLAENLASKGYVVASIGHTDSTFDNVQAFSSTLVNRSLDQLFVLDELGRQSSADDTAVSGLVDADNTTIIGYSMGGYGALNAGGAGYNGFASNFGPGPNLDKLTFGNEEYAELLDDRVKAMVLFAPWGGEMAGIGIPGQSLWDEPALADINIPTFWIVGSEDDISFFEGVQKLFDWSVNSERYLLIYDNALHNVAPNPPPPQAVEWWQYDSYNDPVWDEARINNVNQHFITAFLDQYIKGDEAMADFLTVPVENSNDGVFAVDDEGNFTEDHTYWPGFQSRTATGMSLLYRAAGE